ncbi:adenosylcobalamin-dependent ribonucleoside-diphosphate reductase [Candidatus Puniceispirillum marinum]|uniref:Vitamin B12-dependent ribonucleotide reductase n=1 Tax=Puniceispirillum marinum (strain IMCC1322) TaxID=488538 RepID=D5BQR6_PUNMI|nr:adenosylcobalamin-dependent ribonucleoside-diphosphate reductase [Candidatus Puniceispirillum marinum]ADE38630.1 putative ribonucleoside-diphosphate reductase [Candidatus Puniceispirillum marinum IMCC1322]
MSSKKHNQHYGPSLPLSEEIDTIKYRQTGEDFYSKIVRIADSLKDSSEHFEDFKDVLRNMRFLPAGRVQNAMGAARQTTAFNCFVSGVIGDSMESIMQRATEAAETMRRGGGIGYDFSRLRPRGDRIKSLESKSSGPVSFMGIFDSVCQTIASSGHRRGAQMGVLRIDHPDIEQFLTAKHNSDKLTGFNISIGVTDEFMMHLQQGKPFPLKYDGRTYKEVDPEALWDMVMRSTWDWAEPGVLFIDQINRLNNLWYCETIEATNPCGEQPLPAYGACLLGSFNLVKYVNMEEKMFNLDQFEADIRTVVRAMDNVIDRTIYPLPEQEAEAKAKRRMGLGVTALANAGEMLGLPYGSPEFMDFTETTLKALRDYAYDTSADLAHEKGAFPLFDPVKYPQGEFIQQLPKDIQEKIGAYGIRNSHLTSIAPTGTISLTADNVSSGIEPPFSLYYDRTIQQFDGHQIERVEDYAFTQGVSGRTANEISAEEHLSVLAMAQQYVDSACSKTCNVGDDVSYDDFKNLYMKAWLSGCKGITTFRAAGLRYGILNEVKPADNDNQPKAEACFIDPESGQKECG